MSVCHQQTTIRDPFVVDGRDCSHCSCTWSEELPAKLLYYRCPYIGVLYRVLDNVGVGRGNLLPAIGQQ